MSDLTEEQIDHIHHICDILRPNLKQAIAGGVTDALLKVDLHRQLYTQPDPLTQLQPMPQHECMERLLWCNVYSSVIGSSNVSGRSASYTADKAVDEYNARFPK